MNVYLRTHCWNQCFRAEIWSNPLILFYYFFKDSIYLSIYLPIYLSIYHQRKENGGKKSGRETSVWESNIDWLPLVNPQPMACALTGNQTNDLLLWEMTPNHLSHTDQGKPFHLKKKVGQGNCLIASSKIRMQFSKL